MNEIRYYQGFYFEKNVIEKLVKEQEEFFSEYIPKSVVKNKYFTPKTFPSHEEKLTKYEAPRIAYTLEYTSTMIKDSSWFKISEVEELAKELSEKKRTIKKERTKAKTKETEKIEENESISIALFTDGYSNAFKNKLDLFNSIESTLQEYNKSIFSRFRLVNTYVNYLNSISKNITHDDISIVFIV